MKAWYIEAGEGAPTTAQPTPGTESKMHDTPARSETFLETLTRMGIADALEGYIDPALVRRWGFTQVQAFARQHGYTFTRENGNIYGKLMLVSLAPAAPAPRLRVVTRSDVAAVYGHLRPAA